MKFRDFFNDELGVKWDYIKGLSHFIDLKYTEQSEKWHKEGNAFEHTYLVTLKMQSILEWNGIEKGSDEWMMCMVAAICHDLGKASTTKWSDEKGDWTTKNHGAVGERITRNLFKDEDILQREKVCYMVRHHMELHHVFDKPEEVGKRLIKLSHGIVPIKYMLLLNEADSRGSINDIETESHIMEHIKAVTDKCNEMDCFEKPYSFIDKSQLIRDFVGYEGEVLDERNNFVVCIMCGFPGCGKSTYIEKYLSTFTVISRDNIRAELGIGGATPTNGKKVLGTMEDEIKVTNVFDEKLIECCEKRESFVIDNTDLKYQYRKGYLLNIMKYNPKVKIIYVEAPDFIKSCRERRKGEIAKFVYDRMNEGFDFPQLYECDELVIYKESYEGDTTYKFNGDVIPTVVDKETDTVNRLLLTRGYLIIDGYKTNEKCIKRIDELIEEHRQKKDGEL